MYILRWICDYIGVDNMGSLDGVERYFNSPGYVYIENLQATSKVQENHLITQHTHSIF